MSRIASKWLPLTISGDHVLYPSLHEQEGDSTASLRPYSRTSLTRNGGFIRSASFQAFVDANLKLPSRWVKFESIVDFVRLDVA